MLAHMWILTLIFLLNLSSGSSQYYRQYRQVLPSTQPGVCRFGRKMDCCYGWKRNNKGNCEAQCEHGCRHGECIGPNKCKCLPGYTGKSCNQDMNECGLKPRPCEHRCMNTQGSYMCYCLNGFMLMPDGSCSNSRTCALAHCQYGCEEVQGETRCLCPSVGLQLGPDERTCVDIDECATGNNLCPYNRRCVNTFGSYYCKCLPGYKLKYIHGRYECADTDECANGTEKCSQHADCLNTPGSYKCKCKLGYRGNGIQCFAIPESSVTHTRISGRGHLDKDQNKNAIPEPEVTTSPTAGQQPQGHGEERPVVGLEKNQIDKEKPSPRGDVFFPVDIKSKLGPVLEVIQLPAARGDEVTITDCDFEQGACEWVQDQGDDLEWEVKHSDNGQQHSMAVSGVKGQKKGVARLILILHELGKRSTFCLTFRTLLRGEQVGVLRVRKDNTRHPIWEQDQAQRQDWQTQHISVTWEEEVPRTIIFEAEHSSEVNGEIGLSNVLINSGSCEDDDSVLS